MTQVWRTLAAVFSGIAGWLTFAIGSAADDGSELNYGLLTGPMIGAVLLAGLVLFAAAAIVVFNPRAGRIAIAVGWVLSIPWASWLLLPGMWCRDGQCSVYHPQFVVDPSALVLLCTPLLAFWLARKA